MTNGSVSNGNKPDSSGERTRGGAAAEGSEVECGAACGGAAVHGDWELRGTDRAASDYIAQAREFLEHSRLYLADGHLHQASEKGWGAAAHMAKAVALTQGWEYETHADFHVVMNHAWQRLGDDSIRPLHAIAERLHSNFYRRRRFLDAEAIGADLGDVAELVDALTPLTSPG